MISFKWFAEQRTINILSGVLSGALCPVRSSQPQLELQNSDTCHNEGERLAEPGYSQQGTNAKEL
jgi:hypothetical protein